MCDTYGLITANSTCPFGTSWSQLNMHVAVTVLRKGWMDGCRKLHAALAPDLMYIRYVCTHAYVLSECTDRSMCDAICSHSLVCRMTKRPVTDLMGKTQAVLSPSTVKRFLEANKLLHKEGRHAALPLTCPLCERETSQTVFINKTTGGLV